MQKVTNQEWPPDPIARYFPRRKPIAVQARVDFENDGEVWLPGEAIRWVRPVVFVRLDDKRIDGFGLWVPASDVRRA
ncbi:hypothetical protein FOE78_04605 [Microlunatus elymi]|uniref:Uncharacterized protein n=1 Tax=Microlunatus elymi TaxID=2596828 RepID=A0A516PVS1_9ACTN|nr:hypothetical protein [Microlunatus elymi]QDP95284.1 hypothetical protein FOE78_04605 [Microlunatus elymi]